MSTTYDDITQLGERFCAAQARERVRLTGLSEASVQLLVAKLFYTLEARRIVIVLPQQKDFAAWTEFLEAIEAESHRAESGILPTTISWGNDAYVNRDLPRQQRLHSLSLATAAKRGIFLTTLKGLAQKTLSPENMASLRQTWQPGIELNLDSLTSELAELGYTPTTSVEEVGRYALRGGILDIFPPGREYPVRVEFFGDEIETLREFSPDTQRSLRKLDQAITVGPAAEAVIPIVKRDQIAQRLYDRWIEQGLEPHDRDGMLRSFREGLTFPAYDMYQPLMREESSPSLGYFSQDDIFIFPKSIGACVDQYEDAYEDLLNLYQQDADNKRAILRPDEHYASPDDVEPLFKERSLIDLGNPYDDGGVSVAFRPPSLPPVPMGSASQTFDKWSELLKKQATVILCQSKDQISRIESLLAHRDIKVTALDQPLHALLGSGADFSGVSVGVGDVSAVTRVKPGGPLIVPEHYIFGRRQIKRKSAPQRLKNYLSSFKELKIGGLVVHMDHGIGRYCGLTHLEVGGNKADFLILEYAGQDKVYLPVDKLNLLQRYNPGSDAKTSAPLDKLKSLNWQKRKSRVKKAVRDMADELLKVQAKRALSKGIPYGTITDEYYTFEADFPYSETDDQQRAIADVNADMSAPKPMDRLVCGDVGFGKTEIALRAAFRAVLDGYQVLILVPTTVLCYQHYRTFKARMDKYGVNVAQANRFVKGLDLKLAKEGLAQGKVDILIGTHRLLSKDIKASRLGLLVIDEEQRFGVTHKEKLKEMRASCDVLTLTATPIPRTLHMSMLGLRDISIIATPPHDRLSVKTYVAEQDDTMIADAINNEVQRGGQVFYLHNRVEDIVEVQNRLKELCPQIEIRHAHGQMSEQRLEQVIVDFIEQKFSVLVCTTIIESGIDMPNVNTLIVDRADKFGLAQLYQIRGRVGRSSRQAFAYFFTPHRNVVSEDAMRRLDVLTSYQELGSGFQIASHDLEIRGAGNLLGAEQSGKVGDVGLELYTDMLEQAISEIRGQEVEEQIEPEIKVSFSAIIPESYIADEGLRLELYKRIFSISDRDQLNAAFREAEDRFGKVPKEAELLFKVAELKHLLKVCRSTLLSTNRVGAAELRFAPLKDFHIDALLSAVKNQPKTYALAPDYKLQIFLNESFGKPIEKQINWVNELIGLLEPLAMKFESAE